MKLVSINKLRAGDILLCKTDATFAPVGKAITRATKSEYTHAAICVDPYTVAESVLYSGVRKTSVQELLKRYAHVAVFRQPDAWASVDRLQALNLFIDSVIASGAKYNLEGVATFKQRSEAHQLSLTAQLRVFFQGSSAPAPIVKGNYFCSELVADCYVATGFVQPSAAVVYRSDVTSPGALGRDATFGTFFGYASANEKYVVPATDEFFNVPRFTEIFGDSA